MLSITVEFTVHTRLSLKRGFDGGGHRFGGCDGLGGFDGFDGLGGFSGFNGLDGFGRLDRFSGFGGFAF